MNDIIESVLDELKTMAVTMAKDEAKAFSADAKDFLERAKDDVAKWTKQLKNGEITKEDFRDLLEMKKSVAEMQALKQKGIAKIRLEQLQNQMLDAVTSAVLKAI
ncbi:MAG: hypothetical protein WC334_08525 [Kiritimatiellales bacterium]|jgi:hypothetical protein